MFTQTTLSTTTKEVKFDVVDDGKDSSNEKTDSRVDGKGKKDVKTTVMRCLEV